MTITFICKINQNSDESLTTISTNVPGQRFIFVLHIAETTFRSGKADLNIFIYQGKDSDIV